MEFITMSKRRLTVLNIFHLIKDGNLTLKEGAFMANYSYHHFTRLYKTWLKGGNEALAIKTIPGRPNLLNKEQVQLIKDYYSSLSINGKVPSIPLFKKFLNEEFPDLPKVSDETLRNLLKREGLFPKRRKRRKTYRSRFEAPMPGLIVQGDVSPYKWILGDSTEYKLITFMDDYSRFVLMAKIVRSDTTLEHFLLLRQIIYKYGAFSVLYYDNDSKYAYIRHGGIHVDQRNPEAKPQLVRALEELGVRVVNTLPYRPQGKGKIERFFRTAQSKLPFIFKVKGVRTIEEANWVLRDWIEQEYNFNYHSGIDGKPIERFYGSKERAFRKLSWKEIKRALCYLDRRRIRGDYTIKFASELIQLPKPRGKLSYWPGDEVEIRWLPYEFIEILWKDYKVLYLNLKGDKIENAE